MKTKVVKNGNSQAVRIPAALRLKAREVEIEPVSGGLLIFDPREREKRRRALRKLASLPPLDIELSRP
jgi:antitoxin VapB